MPAGQKGIQNELNLFVLVYGLFEVQIYHIISSPVGNKQW